MKKNIKELIELKKEYNLTFEKIKFVEHQSKEILPLTPQQLSNLLFSELSDKDASNDIEIFHSCIMTTLNERISYSSNSEILKQYFLLLKEKIQQAKDLLVFT